MMFSVDGCEEVLGAAAELREEKCESVDRIRVDDAGQSVNKNFATFDQSEGNKAEGSGKNNMLHSGSRPEKVKDSVSKARLRARRAGRTFKNREKWERYNERNKVEVEVLREDLKRLEALEEARRRPPREASPVDPFKNYFGFDVRKAYPYKKFIMQENYVNELASFDKMITDMMQECQKVDDYRKSHRLFPGEVDRRKMLFAGTMDRWIKDPWGEDRITIWEAVKLADVDYIKHMLADKKTSRDILNAKGVDGETPLHIVTMLCDNGMHQEVFDLLLERGANLVSQTIEGYTPLHYCMICPKDTLVLLERILKQAEESHVHRVRGRENGEEGEAIQENEAPEPWTCPACNHNNSSNTKVCAACNVVPAKWRLELERNRRPVDMCTVYGENLVSMAVKGSRMDRLQLVLQFNPRLDLRDENGNTPLVYAVKQNLVPFVSILLKNGADPLQQNHFGESALTFAKDNNLNTDDDIVMLLSSFAGDAEYLKVRLRWLVPESDKRRSEIILSQLPTKSQVRKRSAFRSRRKLFRKQKFDLDYSTKKVRDADKTCTGI